MLTWVLAPVGIKAKLVAHFMADPSGRYMIGSYTGQNRAQWEEAAAAGVDGGGSGAAQLSAAAAGMLLLQQAVLQAAERA